MTNFIEVTPGEILKEEFLEPMGLSQYRLAKELGVSAICISQIIHGKRAITVETGLLLDKFFGLSEGFWFGIQRDLDLFKAKRVMKKKLAKVKTFVFENKCNTLENNANNDL